LNLCRHLLHMIALAVLSMPVAGICDQNDARLDELFVKLQSSEDFEVLLETEAAIWKIWYDSGEPAIDEKMSMGAEMMEVGDLAAAEEIYSEVIEMLPGFSEGWNRRATVRFYLQDFAGSMADIEETLRLEPRHFGAIWGLGMILWTQRDYQRAILAFERLLELKPHSSDAGPRIEMLKQEMKRDSV